MAARHVVVDGSNLATEGRSMPSLAQLDQAVREFLIENPDDMVTVVVDASFGHRIDSSEVRVFEEAEAAGELVSPPAGAIGRGDAFLLRIADKTGATVLSNDSFQEFHGDYDWLFERGRLIGGKPVPAVGWIFTPRTPVRGPRSREAVKEAKRSRSDPDPAMPGLDLAAERAKSTKGKGKKNVERAIAVALEEVVAPKEKARRPRKAGAPPAEPVNDPLTFITFIAAHPLGGEVTATVESFASHGAFVECEGARCYVPLSAMGEPPPKSAREVFTKGEQVTFVVQALDPQRRGLELAMPGFAKIAGAPTEETVAAEIEARGEGSDEGETAEPAPAPTPAPAKRSRKKAAAVVPPEAPPEVAAAPKAAAAPKVAGARRRAAKAVELAPEAPPTIDEVSRPAPRKRAPAKKAAAAAAAAAAVPERVEAAELASPPRKAPARKRAATPKAAAVAKAAAVPEVPEVSAAPEPPPADVPAPPAARRRRAAVTPPVVAPPVADATAPRRRGRAKSAETPSIAAPPLPEVAPPRSSGRRRKEPGASPDGAGAAAVPTQPAKAPRRRRATVATAAEGSNEAPTN